MGGNQTVAVRPRPGAPPVNNSQPHAVPANRGRFGRWRIFARSRPAQRRMSLRASRQTERNAPTYGEPPSLLSRAVSALRSRFRTVRPVRDASAPIPASPERQQAAARGANPEARAIHPAQGAAQQTNEVAVARSDEDSLAEGNVALLSNYLVNQADAGRISQAEKRGLEPVISVVAQIDRDLVRAAGLLKQSDAQQLTDTERRELSSIVGSHRHNLVVAQRWLGARLADPAFTNPLSPAATTLYKGIQGGFSNRLLNLGDLISRYEFEEDPRAPMSRADTANAHMLHAEAAVRVARNLDVPGLGHEDKHRLIGELEAHRDRLAQIRDAAQGEVRTGSGRLELADKQLWTTPMPLIAFDRGSSRAIDNLRARWAGNSGGNSGEAPLPVTHPKIGQARLLQEFMKFRLRESGVAKRDLPDLEEAQDIAYGKVINDQPWDPIEKRLSTSLPGSEGKPTLVHSRIEPGNAMAAHFAEGYPSNGINSGDRTQYKHVPNLARTSVTSSDGRTTFAGLRHGVIDPYGITAKMLARLPDDRLRTMIGDLLVREEAPAAGGRSRRDRIIDRFALIRTYPREAARAAREMRAQAARGMARELAAAALVSDPAKFEKALAGEAVDLDLASVSLLTPDTYRHLRGKASADEKTMLRNQHAALAELGSSGPVELTVRDGNGAPRTVRANINVRQFNFGVNAGAVQGYGVGPIGVRSHWPGIRNFLGWGFAMDNNSPELERLLGPRNDSTPGGEVGERLQWMQRRTTRLGERHQNLNAMLEADPLHPDAPKIHERMERTAREISELDRNGIALRQAGSQLKTIWAGGDYRKGGGDPYKMVSRLTLVSQLMGEVPLFNCKSGKDRTGQLDAEVKFLATVADETHGQLPPVDQDMARWRAVRGDFTLNTGNLEMQRLNTGLPGYKNARVAGLANMVAEGMMPVYRGGSDYTAM